MGAPLAPRLADSLVDVMAGEEQLGLDTLCVNVLDYQVRLTRRRFRMAYPSDHESQRGAFVAADRRLTGRPP